MLLIIKLIHSFCRKSEEIPNKLNFKTSDNSTILKTTINISFVQILPVFLQHTYACTRIYNQIHIFYKSRIKQFKNVHGNTKDLIQPKQSCKRKTELEAPCSLSSNYATKIQLSRQYDTGTKAETDQQSRTEIPEVNRALMAN